MKIHEEPGANARESEVRQNLGLVHGKESLHCFDFHDEYLLDQEI